MPITQEDLEAFEEEAGFAAGIDAIRRLSVDIELDLEHRGPLYDYVRARHADAVEAMKAIVFLDPVKEAHEIVRNQELIKGWMHACAWIETALEQASDIEERIQERYANGEEIEADAE